MSWWNKNASIVIPASRLKSEPDPAKVLADMRAYQTEFGRKSTIRTVTLVFIFFCAIEFAGNFDEFSRYYFAIISGTVDSGTFSGWKLAAQLESADVTVMVTALLVFNATFAIAFIAAFLIPVENIEFEYFRVDWAQTVQVLVVNSSSLALTLTITRLIDNPALCAVLFIITISIIMVSQLVNSSFLARRSASMAVLDWHRKKDEANKAREHFLSTLNKKARNRLTRSTPSDVKQAMKQSYRCQAVIAISCGLLILAETILILAAFNLFGLYMPSSFLGWLVSVLYTFIAQLIIAVFPLTLITYGQSNLGANFARKKPFVSLKRVLGIIAVYALTLLVFLWFVGTPEWLTGGFLVGCNALLVGIAASAVHWGKRTGRGPGKYVPLHTIAMLDIEALYAQNEYAKSQIKLKGDASIKAVPAQSSILN